MNLDETANFLEMAERKYSINSWKINGICIWPLIRLNLLAKVFSSESELVIEKNQWIQRYEFVKKAFIDNVNVFLLDRKHNQAIKNADVVFFGGGASRNVLMPDKTLMDHNLDPIRWHLENKGVTTFFFEQYGSVEPRLPRWNNSYIVDKMLAETLVRNKLFKSSRKMTCQLPEYDDFLRLLKSRNVDTSDFLPNKIKKYISNIQSLADMFLVLLDKIKPKVVVLVDWQSISKMALSLASHKLKVPVLEVQHGVAASGGRNNITYCNWSSIPKGGYELVPDYMWVWDKSDYDSMNNWAKESWRPFVGGHPMNLIWGDTNNKLTKFYQEKYADVCVKDKPVILFTLQWGMVYPKWIVDYINAHEEYCWIIRRHPIPDKHIEKFISQIEKKDNVVINKSDFFPLEILLVNAALHITMYSSVVIDAEAFLCPSVVLHPKAKDYFSKQINDNMACFVDDNMMLDKKIKELVSKVKEKTRNTNFSELHEKGCKAIDKIISIVEENRPSWEKV